MQCRGIHHVAIVVDDLDVALDFYVTKLGFAVLPRPDVPIQGAWLAAGDQQVHLAVYDDQPRNSAQHFALAVDDLDGTVDELTTLGIKCRRLPEIPLAGRQAMFRDPFGNTIELNQRPAPVGAAG
jgi:catechol 2,3-dioxygenase-like lactoylglutathione lyase family enzyme